MATKTRRRIRTTLLVVAAAATIGVLAWLTPMGALFFAAMDWIRTAGPLGFVAFAGLYGLGTLLALPASWLQGSSGLLYGPLWGMASTVGLSMAWSTVSFLLGRTLLRAWVQRRIARWTVFEALDGIIERRGLYLVVLLRLSPVMPFNVVSYALGVTRVRVRDYVLGTAIGALVPMFLFTSLGASVGDLAALLAGEVGVGWMQAVGLGATIVATLLVTRFARRALAEAMEARRLVRIAAQPS